MASLGRDQVGSSVKKKVQTSKVAVFEVPTHQKKKNEIGRRIIDLSFFFFFFAESFDNGCCKCGQMFELKNSIKETNLGHAVPSTLFAQTAPLFYFENVRHVSKEMHSGRRKPYAVNVKAGFGKYALCVYTLFFVCTSYNSYMKLYFAKRYVVLLKHKFHNGLRSYHQSVPFFATDHAESGRAKPADRRKNFPEIRIVWLVIQ